MKRLSPKLKMRYIIGIALVFLGTSTIAFILFRPGGALSKYEQISPITTDQETNPQITSPLSPELSDSRYLTFNEWGVKLKVPDNLDGVRYYKTTEKFYQFSTERVEALGDICAEPNDRKLSAVRLGGLGRTTKPDWNTDENPPLSGKAIEGYYYYYQGPQSTCSTKNTDLQYSDVRLIETMIKSLLPI